MKLTRRELLASSAALLAAPRAGLGQSGPASDAKHLIVVFAEGGWDITFCFDPKLSCSGCSIEGPEVDELPNQPNDREAVQTFGQIPIVVNDFKRPSIRPFFQQWHSHAHVINGVWTGSIAHDPCRYRILTGTPTGTSPDLASIAGATHGGNLPLGAVDLSGWGIAGPLASASGRIGHQSQIAALLDGGATFRAPSQTQYPLFRADPDADALIDQYLRDREAQLRARFADSGINDARLDDLLESSERAGRFRAQSDEALKFLTVGQQANFSQQIRMAVDLIEAQVCHAVTLDTRDDWDTHDVNSAQHVYWDNLFVGLGELMRELEQRAMLDNVVVAVLSEMTRTPLRNTAAGKDHWGHTSALLLGGGVRGDSVSGGTDDLLESRPVDLATGELTTGGQLLKYDNLAAGILELVGVDPGDWLPGTTPFRGAHAG